MTTFAGTEGAPAPLLAVIAIGFLVGVIKGFLGVGGGVLLMPALIYGVGCSTRMAVGTSLAVVVLSSVAGTVTHGVRGNVSLTLVSLILISSTTGAGVGALYHHKIKPHQVRLYFSFVLLATFIVIAATLAHRFGLFG